MSQFATQQLNQNDLDIARRFADRHNLKPGDEVVVNIQVRINKNNEAVCEHALVWVAGRVDRKGYLGPIFRDARVRPTDLVDISVAMLQSVGLRVRVDYATEFTEGELRDMGCL